MLKSSHFEYIETNVFKELIYTNLGIMPLDSHYFIFKSLLKETSIVCPGLSRKEIPDAKKHNQGSRCIL